MVCAYESHNTSWPHALPTCRTRSSTTGGSMARRDERPTRILIVTAGSRGDVAPFTGLGQQLQQAGHRVALAAYGMFADLVRGCGLEYRPLPGDPVALTRARMAAPSPEDSRLVFAEFL